MAPRSENLSKFASTEPELNLKKKKKTKKPFSRTYRFNITLNPPKDGKSTYKTVDWLDLVAKEEEAKIEAKRKEVLDPFASDDEDQLKTLAKQFEEKYGGVSENIRQKKRRRHQDDYADLGFGYEPEDSDDDFIDNSEMHDEIVPEELDTAHGGFYINKGPLEFKTREYEVEDSDDEIEIVETKKAVKK